MESIRSLTRCSPIRHLHSQEGFSVNSSKKENEQSPPSCQGCIDALYLAAQHSQAEGYCVKINYKASMAQIQKRLLPPAAARRAAAAAPAASLQAPAAGGRRARRAQGRGSGGGGGRGTGEAFPDLHADCSGGDMPPLLQPALGVRDVPGNLCKLAPNFKGKNFMKNMHNH